MNLKKLIVCLVWLFFLFHSTSFATERALSDLPVMSLVNGALNWRPKDEFQNNRVGEGEVDPVLSRNNQSAWELVEWHGKPDLSNAQITRSEKKGSTPGLNWFIKPNLYITADYGSVDYNRSAIETDQAKESDDSGLFQTRIQLNF